MIKEAIIDLQEEGFKVVESADPYQAKLHNAVRTLSVYVCMYVCIYIHIHIHTHI